ncbi:microcystin degradation protein MlrC, partial [Burkholderia multivorans]|uniref:M81 family metallopeptidase n=1 Tax=Burkholderia multivorans TaxID=87883 RepID=UPI000DB3CD84
PPHAASRLRRSRCAASTSSAAAGATRAPAARAAEADGMLAVSVLPGFSLADIPAPCISVVVVGDGDRAAADAV